MICVLRGSYEQFSIILAKGEKKAVQCCRMTLKTKAPTVWAALQEVSSISCSGLCQSPRTLWAHHNWKHERNYSKNSWKHVYLLWRKIWKLPKQNQTLFHFAFVFPFLQVQWWKLKKADLKKKKKKQPPLWNLTPPLLCCAAFERSDLLAIRVSPVPGDSYIVHTFHQPCVFKYQC